MLKICSKCRQAKDDEVDFYQCYGCCRSECKACTIKRNIQYQRRTKPWRDRDSDLRKSYMREYYHKNKDKFAAYRAKFRSIHPGYHRDYFMKNKEKTSGKRLTSHKTKNTYINE